MNIWRHENARGFGWWRRRSDEADAGMGPVSATWPVAGPDLSSPNSSRPDIFIVSYVTERLRSGSNKDVLGLARGPILEMRSKQSQNPSLTTFIHILFAA